MFCALLVAVHIVGIALVCSCFAATLVGRDDGVDLLALHGGGGGCTLNVVVEGGRGGSMGLLRYGGWRVGGMSVVGSAIVGGEMGAESLAQTVLVEGGLGGRM